MIQFTVNGSPNPRTRQRTPRSFGSPRRAKLTGTKFGVRRGSVRRVHGPYRWRARLLLPNPNRRGGGPQGHDDRRVIGRFQPSRSAGHG